MSELIGMKIMADLCFAAAFFSVLPWFQEETIFLLAFFVCGGLGMGLSAVLKERRVLRFLPIGIMGLPLALSHGTAQMVVIAIAALYILAMMVGKGYQVSYWQYLMQSKVLIILMLVTIFAALVRDQGVPRTIALFFLYLALNSYVLRQSRLGRYADRRSGVLNFLYLVGCCLLAVLLAAILTGLSYLDLSQIGQIIAWPFAMVLYALSWLYNLLGSGVRQGNDAGESNQNLMDLNDKELQEYSREATANAGDGMDWTMPNLWKILAVLVILLLIAAFVYFLYRFVKHLLEQNVEWKQDSIFETEKIDTTGDRKKRISGNRRKIRKFYRGYLSYLRSRGVDVRRSMTSREVLDANFDVTKIEEEEQLRELYIKARYDEKIQPDNQDVQQTKDLLEKIRKKDKEKDR